MLRAGTPRARGEPKEAPEPARFLSHLLFLYGRNREIRRVRTILTQGKRSSTSSRSQRHTFPCTAESSLTAPVAKAILISLRLSASSLEILKGARVASMASEQRRQRARSNAAPFRQSPPLCRPRRAYIPLSFVLNALPPRVSDPSDAPGPDGDQSPSPHPRTKVGDLGKVGKIGNETHSENLRTSRRCCRRSVADFPLSRDTWPEQWQICQTSGCGK